MRRFLSAILAVVLVFSIPMPAFTASDTWTCSNGHENSIENLFCGKCGEAKPEEDESWTCTKGHENLSENTFCTTCGEKRPVNAGDVEEEFLQEPFENEADFEFTFRNGIHWGMSESEIRDLEGLGDSEDNSLVHAINWDTPDGHSIRNLFINYFLLADDNENLTLSYSLFDDRLYYIGYERYEQIDAADIVRELTSEYGAEVPITNSTKAEFVLNWLGHAAEFENEASLMNDPRFNAVAETMHYWILPDDTEILVGVDSLEKNPYLFICYWNKAYRTSWIKAELKPTPTPTPQPTPTPTPQPTPTPTPQPTPSPKPVSNRVTLKYSDGREVSYSRDEMRSALGGNMVLLRNSCMDVKTDCDMTPVYEAMDFAILKGAVIVTVPLTPEQFETAYSWINMEMTDAVPGINPDAYAWNKFYKILFPTLYSFMIYDNHDGTYTIHLGFQGGSGTTNEGIAEAIAKGREAALKIVKNIPASCYTGNVSEFKKVEYLYDYITHYVKYYDDSAWSHDYYDDRDHVHLLYDALVSRETVCAGFSYAFAYLCELAGIDAQYVVMESYSKDNDLTHAAVIAKEHVSYHWFDPTWDEGKNLTEFDYFGITDTEMFHHHEYSRTYYPRSLYPDCGYGLRRGRMGYWDFDAMIYRYFTSETIGTGRYCISSALDKNRVLEINGYSTENGGNAQVFYNGFIGFQQFDISMDGDKYILRNCGSSLVLDVEGGKASSGTNVQQYESNSTAAQKWIIKPVGYADEGYYYIKSTLGELYLEVAGDQAFDRANVQISSHTGKENQKWRFTEVNSTSVIDGRYIISSAMDNNRVLEIGGYSTEERGNAQIYYNSDKHYFQRFDVYQSDGGYVLKSQGSGLVLAVDSNRNVCQMKYGRGLSSQRWTIKSAGNGYFYIKSASGDNYLEVAGSSAADGTNVRVSGFTGKDNQKWRLNLTAEMTERTW